MIIYDKTQIYTGVINMSKGKISVHTDNLLPIIKKWLYSDSDIFMRELISNAQDAIMKLKKLNALGQTDIDDKYEIKVTVDKENSIITVEDNGIGMTEQERAKGKKLESMGWERHRNDGAGG